jgi:folate-binding protein YgfZ
MTIMGSIGEDQLLRRYARVVLKGRDAVSFTQSQVSNDVTVAPGLLRGTLILDPNGRINVAASYLVPSDEEVWLVTHPAKIDALTERLQRFAIRVKMTTTVDDVWLGVPLVGGDREVENQSPFVNGERVGLAEVSTNPSLLPTDDSDDLSLRIAKRRCDHLLEGFADLVPAALGETLEAVVSFTKGCYTGQELVARMDSRGANAPSAIRWFATAEWPEDQDEHAVDGLSIKVAASGQVAGELGGVVRTNGRIEGFALIGRKYDGQPLVLSQSARYDREIVELSGLSPR